MLLLVSSVDTMQVAFDLCLIVCVPVRCTWLMSCRVSLAFSFRFFRSKVSWRFQSRLMFLDCGDCEQGRDSQQSTAALLVVSPAELLDIQCRITL